MRQAIPVLLLSVLFIFPVGLVDAQQLNGVFAGLDLTASAAVGGRVNRVDIAYYFRPDGTFTNKLDQPTWKTDVAGRYRIGAGKVSLTSQDGTTLSYTLTDKGNLSAGRYQLFPMNGTSNIPPGLYTYTRIVDGGVSPKASVDLSDQVGLTIDGKGNFSQDRALSTLLQGSIKDAAGRNRSSGTYSWKEGTLALRFTNGQTELHSFFFLPGNNPVMAAIDGRVCFQDDQKVVGVTKAAQPNEPTPVVAPFTRDALSLMRKANLIHGGLALDAIKTIRIVSLAASLQVTTLIDLTQRNVRVELRANDKLVSVEQLEGRVGWQWRNCTRTDLPQNRIDELTNVFTTGILGLRSAAIATLPPLQAKPLENGMTAITYQSAGALYTVMLNASNQLAGIGNNLAKLQTTVVYTNMKLVNGVLLPFGEEQSAGSQKLTIRHDAYQINPVFSAINWSVPN